MTDSLKPCRVTLIWRRYGNGGIEWRPVFDPWPIEGLEHALGWKAESAGDPDPLYRAAFRLGADVAMYRVYAMRFAIVEEPALREPPLLGGSDDLDGKLDEDGLVINFGGGCPVQGFGELDGCFVYYRARGTGWSFEIWPPGAKMDPDGSLPDGEPQWSYDKPDVYAWPDGGWLHRETSYANLREALAAWRSRAKE